MMTEDMQQESKWRVGFVQRDGTVHIRKQRLKPLSQAKWEAEDIAKDGEHAAVIEFDGDETTRRFVTAQVTMTWTPSEPELPTHRHEDEDEDEEVAS